MYYVMSDIHGCYEEMNEVLEHWDRETETLVVLGDLIDRGPDSYKVVRGLMDLKRDYPEKVIVLSGNHDEMFVNWLVHTKLTEIAEEDHHYLVQHRETLKSFYEEGNSAEMMQCTIPRQFEYMNENYAEELEFLAELPLFHETDKILFVHAGINLKISEWSLDTSAMRWIRNEFIYSKVVAPKRVFFGHTPTEVIRNEKQVSDVWISPEGDKVGIDGACVFGRELHALRVGEDGEILENIRIKSKKN